MLGMDYLQQIFTVWQNILHADFAVRIGLAREDFDRSRGEIRGDSV